MASETKVAIVTGGTKGIGAAVVTRLADEGYACVVTYGRDHEAAQKLLASLPHSDRHLSVQSDARDLAGIDALIAQVLDRYGRIDLVIPSAGIMIMKPFEQFSEQDFDVSFNLNVKGPFFLVQKAAPHLVKTKGRVILISTSQCKLTTIAPPYTTYMATKGAIEQFVRGLAKDLGARGVFVNAVAPGPTATDLFFEGKSKEMVDFLANLPPLKRLGQPHEVAAAICALAGTYGDWVNGQILYVNGGAG